MFSAEEYFSRGKIKQAEGDLQGAISDYGEAIKLKPAFAKAWSNRGHAKYEQDDLQGAISDLDEAINLNFDLVEAWNNRGLVKQDQGDRYLQGAIADLGKAIELNPDYAAIWSNRGHAKYKQGDLQGAIADYGEAIKRNHALAEAWYNRGIAKRLQGDLQGAIADYGEAINHKPNYAEVWNNRGVARETQGDLQGAISDYGEAINYKPNYAEAWYNRGIAKRAHGDLQGAIADYGEAIKRKPAWWVKAWNNRGIAKRAHGDLQGAIADYNKAIKLKPDLVQAWVNRGIAKQSHGNLQGAITDYNKAIKLKHDYAEAWFSRGTAKEYKGNLQGAIADYDEAIKFKPDLAEAWINRSVVRDAKKIGVNPEAIWKIFDKAYSAIGKLRKALIEDKKKDQFNPIHYTNRYTLLNLAKGGKFRLYNAKNMDDSEEGNALFDLFDKKHRVKIRCTFSAKSSDDLEDFEVYIGSFVPDNYSDERMWKERGQHNGKEGAGCALVFDKEQHFSSQPLPLTNLLEARLLELGNRLLENQPGGFTVKEQDEIVTKKECYLYPVCYKPTEEIQDKVDNLCEELEQLRKKKYEETCKIVAVLLNHVRHLFKHKVYEHEKEYRLTILRARKSPAVTEDPPRTYVECSLKMKEVTVLLGPEAKKAEIWKQWLEDTGSFKEIKTTDK